ncbi:DUF952 domain-containing protein [Nocardia asteroides]|uniref:DUF952 domain-containing protein n=1 Tax=Nocardia asteroides TaxID=1824 RepID=UPI001E2CD21B|nr:DUF952 domain-containing protein [Nocardia asteroides]UGT56658.1 DUF952 domain-containing protein [Nocardia asteroides]
MISDTHTLVHLCSSQEWEHARAAGERRPPSLTESGFVHLSTPAQVHLPANRLYAGRTDMVVLWLDPARLAGEVRWEPGVPTDPASMLFPHLYGPLPVDAVLAAEPYPPGPDGAFTTPRRGEVS